MKYLLMLCVLLFTACSTKRDSQFPSLNKALHVKGEKISLEHEWWREYGQKELNFLIARALKQNISLKQGALNIKKSMLNLDASSLELLPSFSGGASSSVSRKIDKGKASFSHGANFSLSYQLDIWGKIKDKYEAQEYLYKATKEELRSLKLSTINKIINLYFNLAYINDTQKLTKQNLKNYKKTYDLTHAKFEYGRADELELSQAEESLLEMENSLTKLQSQALHVKQNLRDILNLKPHEKLNLDNISLKEIKALHVSLETPFIALSKRPDLKATELRLRAAFIEEKASEKNLYPTISLGASLSSQGKAIKDVFSFNLLSGNLRVNLPFLDYKRVQNNIKVSKIEYETRKLSFEETLTKALNELDTLYKEHEFLKKNYQTQQKKQKIQTDITHYQKTRYEYGKSPFGSYLRALTAQTNSKQTLIHQKYLILQNENKIFHALGGKM